METVSTSSPPSVMELKAVPTISLSTRDIRKLMSLEIQKQLLRLQKRTHFKVKTVADTALDKATETTPTPPRFPAPSIQVEGKSTLVPELFGPLTDSLSSVWSSPSASPILSPTSSPPHPSLPVPVDTKEMTSSPSLSPPLSSPVKLPKATSRSTPLALEKIKKLKNLPRVRTPVTERGDTKEPSITYRDYIKVFAQLSAKAADLFDDETDESTPDERRTLAHQLQVLATEMNEYILDSTDDYKSCCPCFKKCVEGVVELTEQLQHLYDLITLVADIID